MAFLSVLGKIAEYASRVSEKSFMATVIWNETTRQKDGTIKRQTGFPADATELILSGPQFFVGNPFYKTPRAVCTQNSHYDSIDLIDLPDDYLPRTNYVPACPPQAYEKRIQNVDWDENQPITAYFRLAFRQMIYQVGERTLVPALIPKDVTHINTCLSLVFDNAKDLSILAGMSISLVMDFFIKTTGMTHLHGSLIAKFPFIQDKALQDELILRTLSLSCLTVSYRDLWQELWSDSFKHFQWTKTAPPLNPTFFADLTPEWTRNCALRTPYERRQALLEIDVIVAMALGITLEELITIYRGQFYLLQQYEAGTYYDTKGRIVFTNNNGLPGVGLPRKANPQKDRPSLLRHADGRVEERLLGWEDIAHLEAGATVSQTLCDDTQPGGPREKTITYHAPFACCDREEDYRTTWAEFGRRFGEAPA